MTRRTLRRALTTLAGTLLLLGCGETLDPASLLNKTRPLGVLLSVEGDPTRTTPAGGETLNLTFLMGHAAEELPVSFFAVFCVPAPSTLGVPFCATDDNGDPLLVGGVRSGADVVGDPGFTLPIPTDDELDALGVSDELLMLARRLTLLRGDVQPNVNPGIASLMLTGGAWESVPGSSDPATGCAGMGLPEARQGGEPLPILMRPTGDARETYEVLEDDVPTSVREVLQVTTLATAGEMQRTFNFIDDERDVVTVEWLPPEADTPAEGTRVRFEFVMRDGRGGLARVRRQLCLLP